MKQEIKRPSIDDYSTAISWEHDDKNWEKYARDLDKYIEKLEHQNKELIEVMTDFLSEYDENGAGTPLKIHCLRAKEHIENVIMDLRKQVKDALIFGYKYGFNSDKRKFQPNECEKAFLNKKS